MDVSESVKAWVYLEREAFTSAPPSIDKESKDSEVSGEARPSALDLKAQLMVGKFMSIFKEWLDETLVPPSMEITLRSRLSTPREQPSNIPGIDVSDKGLRRCHPDGDKGKETVTSEPKGVGEPMDNGKGSLSAKQLGKRKVRGSDDSDADSTPSRERRGPPKRTKTRSLEGGAKKLACPYFKRNEDAYNRVHKGTACVGEGWTEIRRVREHILRHHAMGLRCSRCRTKFETAEALEQHKRAVGDNEPRARREREGCDLETETLVRNFRPSRGMTEKEKWTQLYKLLFPHENEDSIPSPCKSLSHLYTCCLFATKRGG